MESILKNKIFKIKLKNPIQKDFLKHRIVLIVLLALLSIAFGMIGSAKTAQVPLQSQTETFAGAPVVKGERLTQEIFLDTPEKPKSVSFEMAPINSSSTAVYTAQLNRNNGDLLCKAVFSADAAMAGPINLALPLDIDLRGESITLLLYSEDAEEWAALAPVSVSAVSENEALHINNNPTDQKIAVTASYAYTSSNIWIIAVITLAAGVFYILFMNRDVARDTLFAILAFGVLFSLISPILDVPDEQAHLAKSLMVSTGNFFQSTPDGNPVTVSYNDVYGNFRNTIANVQIWDVPIKDETFIMNDWISLFFAGYIPQALGFALAKLLHINMLPAFYMARIFNLLFYAFLAYAAVRIAKRFKLFLSLIAMMPMAVYISASLNSDAYVYGLSLLLIAYFINLYFDESKPIAYKEILIFTVLCIFVSIKKYNYAPFLFLLFTIPKKRFATRKTKYFGCLITLILVALSVIGVFALTSFGLASEGDSLKSGEVNAIGANVGEQIKFAMGNKGAAVRGFLSSLFNQLGGNLAQMFTFGWLSYSLHDIFVYFYFAFIAVVAFSYTRYIYHDDDHSSLAFISVSLASRIGIILVISVIVAATYFMMYLTWTPVGALEVWGVQGRYFVSVFLLLPFLGQNTDPVVSKDSYERSRYNILFIAMIFIVIMLFITASVYY